MLDAREVRTEPEVMELRSNKNIPDKPMLDNRDMVAIMCIICSALITYLFIDKNEVIVGGIIQLSFVIMVQIAWQAVLMFWIAQKIVKFCHIRAKRKAVGQAGD